jgi:hypothetical protein
MGSLIRTLLICFLVLAVPAQGAAAVTMAYCGPNHHGRGAATDAQQTASGKHSHHGIDSQPAIGHDDPAAQAVHADKQKCSACASCCTFGVVLSTVLDVPAPDLAPTRFSAVSASVEAFVAEGPDRPPRMILA